MVSGKKYTKETRKKRYKNAALKEVKIPQVIMSRKVITALTNDCGEETNPTEVGGAFAVVFCMFSRSHHLTRERERERAH